MGTSEFNAGGNHAMDWYPIATSQNANTFLTGSQNSKIKEMEVFVFKK